MLFFSSQVYQIFVLSLCVLVPVQARTVPLMYCVASFISLLHTRIQNYSESQRLFQDLPVNYFFSIDTASLHFSVVMRTSSAQRG